jgi:folate-binding protein YgfZ
MIELFERVSGLRAAWRSLPERGVLRLTGADRVRFLDGMVTNEVVSLAAGRSAAALLLDRKGKILAELFVLAEPAALWLDVGAGRAPVVRAALEKHVIADDVAIEDASAALGQLAFEGPAAAEAARSLGAPALGPGAHARLFRGEHEILWRGGGSLDAERGMRALAPPAALEHLARESGLSELAPAAAEILRIERFQPAFGVDFDESNFPAEARLEHALSFSKGCYIGQEFVARIRSRGAVNRLLVRLACAAPVSRGAAIESAGGRRAGEVTSAVVSPVSGALALGYVKREHAAPGTELRIAGAPARVTGPPLEPEP